MTFYCVSGADPTLVDGDNNSSLHLSTLQMAKHNQSTILLSLVSNRPDALCQKNKSGLTALHMALKNLDYQSVSYLMPEIEGNLIEQAQRSLLIVDSVGRHSLHYAAHSGLTTFIERYFKKMSKDVINQQDSFGLTALHYAWYVLNYFCFLLLTT